MGAFWLINRWTTGFKGYHILRQCHTWSFGLFCYFPTQTITLLPGMKYRRHWLIGWIAFLQTPWAPGLKGVSCLLMFVGPIQLENTAHLNPDWSPLFKIAILRGMVCYIPFSDTPVCYFSPCTEDLAQNKEDLTPVAWCFLMIPKVRIPKVCV